MEILVGPLLDGTLRVIEEDHVFRLSQIRQVDQDADFAAKGRLKNGVKETIKIELGELAVDGRGLNGGHGGGHSGVGDEFWVVTFTDDY
jgi:hypothetical protein